ncbi:MULTISPECIES: serine hydrolase [unclassified Bifidobacterium]|uniref:serine hydrolase n=1 Tax=unclassified Bifidobacterium TaxID=2608897 RepID=UPI001125DDF1|nr:MULTISPECIES: serine hydrolase [unclassified Bifidobacterium]
MTGKYRARSTMLHRQRIYRRRRIAMAGVCAACMVAGLITTAHSPWWLNGGDASIPDAVSSEIAAARAGAESASEAKKSDAVPLTPLQKAVQNVGSLDGSAQVSAVGFQLSADQQSQLEQQLNAIASYGYQASFTLVDVSTGAALSSYGGTARYSASAVKGPYVLSLAATGAIDINAVYQSSDTVAADDRNLIEQTITVSDNDAYAALHDSYGGTPLGTWASGLGVTADVTDTKYYDISSNDLARLWLKGQTYLFSTNASDDGTADARQWLASEYSDTLNSAIHMALGDQYAVNTKAGWIDEGGYVAQNDAGIVHSGSGDYVLAVMTDAYGEYNLLADLIVTLDQIHSASMHA